jgi:guanylate kinase
MPNIELLAHCRDTPAIRAAIEATGAVLVHGGDEAYPPADRGSPATELPVPQPVKRRLVSYQGDRWRASLFRLMDRHELLELRISYYRDTELDWAVDTLHQLRGALGIREVDLVPWSLEQTGAMVAGAELWRSKLGDLSGRLFLIDGPSGAGKSTLVHALRREALPGYRYVPRCTSRPRRPDDEAVQEYIPLSVAEFEQHIDEGRFLEFRQFMFYMSYGLRWDDVGLALSAPGTLAAYAMVNLGNIRHVREFVPEATTILVTAPIEQIRDRLVARGAHRPEAIEERLHNASVAGDAAGLSDIVIFNYDGEFEAALRRLRDVITGAARASNRRVLAWGRSDLTSRGK